MSDPVPDTREVDSGWTYSLMYDFAVSDWASLRALRGPRLSVEDFNWMPRVHGFTLPAGLEADDR